METNYKRRGPKNKEKHLLKARIQTMHEQYKIDAIGGYDALQEWILKAVTEEAAKRIH